MWFLLLFCILSLFYNKHVQIEMSKLFWGFPGDSVVKNPPANAGDMGSIPDLERSHRLRSNWAWATRQSNLCSRAQEPQLRSSHAATTEAGATWRPWPVTREAPAVSLCAIIWELLPVAVTRKKALSAKNQHSQKQNKLIFIVMFDSKSTNWNEEANIKLGKLNTT